MALILNRLNVPEFLRQPRVWLRLVFWHPMFWVAIALHGVVLFVPLAATKQPTPPKPDEDPGIKLTKLTAAPKAAAKPPQQTPAQSVRAQSAVRRQPRPVVRRETPSTPAVVIKAQPAVQPSPPAKPKATATPDSSTPPDADPSAPATPAPTPVTPKSSPDGIAVNPQTGALIQEIDGSLQNLFAQEGLTEDDRQNANNAISSILFPDETLPYFFADADNDIVRSGIKSVKYAPNLSLEVVQAALVADLSAYTVTPMGDYGTQPLYKLERDSVVRYLSLVAAKKPGRSTFILLWEKQPE